MHFIHPWYLTGLLALAIPIIIHLFNFHRYKKIYFTNVRFLEVLQTETRRTSRLRNIILLLLRMLFITAVVLAFAQPYFGQNYLLSKTSGRTVSIYLDNSFSMLDDQGNQNRWTKAKSRALEIVSLFGSGDQYHLLTNDRLGGQQHLVTQSQTQIWINESEPSARQIHTNDILESQANSLTVTNKNGRIAFFISDFSRSFFNPGPPPDTTLNWVFVPVSTNTTDNVSIDCAWFEEPLIYPGLLTALKVKLTNHSTESTDEIGIKLMLNKIQRGFKSISLKPSASEVISIPFQHSDTGFINGQLEISDNEFPYDNKLFMSFKGQPPIQVLMIGGTDFNPYLSRLFRTDSSIRVTRQLLRQVDYSLISQSSLTILDEVTEYPSGLLLSIKKALEEGRCLTIIPHPNKGLQELESFLKQLGIESQLTPANGAGAVGEINSHGILFKNVIEEMPEYPALPSVKEYIRIKTGLNPVAEIQMKLKNDDPFLLVWPVGKGRVFLQACPLREEYTDFMHNNLFVPAWLNMAFAGQFQNPLYAVTGKPGIFTFENTGKNDDKAPELVSIDKGTGFIPPFRRSNGQLQILTGNEISTDGIFNVRVGNKILGNIAVNYTRNESYPAVYSREEIQSLLEQQGWKNFQVLEPAEDVPIKAALEAGGGRPLPRKWLAWAALLFLTSEVILLRFWK